MKITILNGSPKGDRSITLQYANFIEKRFPQHEMKVFHVSRDIKKLERDEKAFQEIIEEVRSSDGILWSFGLWVLCAPAQYMRFIELISERGAEEAFRDKYAAVLTTSIHYFDHTAHNYMRAVCEDLDMRFADGISFDLVDLMEESNREKLTTFAESFFEAIEKKIAVSRLFQPLRFSGFAYQPSVSNYSSRDHTRMFPFLRPLALDNTLQTRTICHYRQRTLGQLWVPAFLACLPMLE